MIYMFETAFIFIHVAFITCSRDYYLVKTNKIQITLNKLAAVR